MVVNDVGGNHFQKSKNRAGVMGVEVPKQPTIVGAKFQEGVLNQVVQLSGDGLSPISRRAEGYGRNQRTKSAYKFNPSRLLSRLETNRDQFFRG